MAFDRLQYGKTWEDPTDFPTYEDSEEQVRADMQYHPDAVKDYLNNTLLPAMEEGGAGSIGAELPGGEAGTVQGALDALDGRQSVSEADIETLQADDADHESRIVSLEGTAEDHESRVGALEADDADHGARIEALEGTAAAHGSRLGALESTAAEHTETLTDHGERLTANEARTRNQAQEISVLQAESVQYGAALTTLAGAEGAANVGSGETNVESRLDGIDGDIGRINEEIDELNESYVKLERIEVTTPPTKISYAYGESFDPAGMVVTATYSNGATMACTGYRVTPEGPISSIGTVEMTVQYTEFGISKTAAFNITVVKAAGSLSVSPTAVTLEFASPAAQVAVTRAGDGQITAESSDGAIAQASVVGNIVVIETVSEKTGACTVTVRVAEGTGHTAPDPVTVAVTASFAQPVEVPTVTSVLTYNGSEQSPTFSGYDPEKMVMGGTTAGTNAGTYSASFTPKPGYEWTDGTSSAKTVNWSIGKAFPAVIAPTVLALTYTGSAQALVGAGGTSGGTMQYSTDNATWGTAVPTGINAGSYTVYYRVAGDTNYYDAAGGSVAASIGKAAGSVTVSPGSLSLTAASPTGTISVSRPGDGAVSASSSDTSVATVSVSGTAVTVTALKTGSATITVNVAEGSNYTAASGTAGVEAILVPTVLNDATWAQISEHDADGANYWSVGDCKQIHIEGTVGTLELNTGLCVYIIGFNHNGAMGIDFGTFKTALTGGVDVCLVDSKYNDRFHNGEKYFTLNHWGYPDSNPYNTNYGGWNGCDARYDILGSTNQPPSGYGSMPQNDRVGYDATSTTATSPVAKTLMAALPSDLRAVMKPITIFTSNKGGNASSTIAASVDYLPLLAEYEIHGYQYRANQYEQNYQEQYAYYSSGNSKIKYNHANTEYAQVYFGRSPSFQDSYGFAGTYPNGSPQALNSDTSHGISPFFRV